MIDRTLQLRAYQFGVRSIVVKRDLGLLPLVLADEHQIQQVLLNIIVNAEQAMYSNGSGILTLTTEIDEREEGDVVKIAIADTGPGIEPELMTKMFDPFFTTKSVGEGTGLGLSIALDIIREHGGVITVKSHLGKGTEFVIQIPCSN